MLTGSDLEKSGRWSETRDPYLLETSVPGIFACGDVRFSPVKRVASAVGEGSMAIAFVHQFLALTPADRRRHLRRPIGGTGPRRAETAHSARIGNRAGPL